MYPSDPNMTPAGMPPVAPRKRHHYIRWTFAGLAALIVLIAVVSVAAGAGKKGTPAAVSTQSTSAPATQAASPAQSATPVAAVPSPDGTFTGACDYTLGNDPAGGTAVATGDITAANTGNIGMTVRLTITWPQQGYSPLRESKTVRVPAGGSQDVQFNMPLTYDQLSNLQNWQLGHAGDTGCTYNGTMTGTYGTAS